MIEKRCYRCHEDWPADEEFYYRLGDGRLHSYCKACVTERCRELRSGATRIVNRRSNNATPTIQRTGPGDARPAV